jgi:DNA (cytosine-5)-methyltransferase 1
LILSPHTIHPFFGGTPQVRERVFICATKMNKNGKKELYLEPGIPDITSITEEWDPNDWDLFKDLPVLNKKDRDQKAYALGRKEQNWLNAWNDFVMLMNSIFYTKNKKKLDRWRRKWEITKFPASRRKFEWQAQDSLNLKSCIIHFRPSGIRVKKPNYVPTLVAMNQTTILGKEYRKLTPRECARLQGFPEWFDQNRQEESLSYKQLGNAVNISVAYHVFRAQIKRDIDLLIDYPNLIKTVLDGPNNPVKKLNELDQLDIQLVESKNTFPAKNKQLKIN